MYLLIHIGIRIIDVKDHAHGPLLQKNTQKNWKMDKYRNAIG